MSNRKVVLLPIETKVRELDGILLLAYELVKKGFEVVIGPKREVNVGFDLIKPNIYIIDSARKTDDKVAISNKLKNSGTKIIVLDTEGAIFLSEDRFLERLSSEVLSNVEAYFCWGKEVKNIIQRNNLFPMDKVFITGYPSIDLTKKGYRSFYNSEVGYLKKEYGRFILINTNFSTINHYSESLDISKGLTKKEKGNKNEIYNKEQFYILSSFLEAINLILEEWKEHKIIIRPHPSENHDFYKKYFKNNDRIVVKHEYNARSWILASDILIHNGCTTGIEAAMLEEPVISFNPIDKQNNLSIPDKIGESVLTKEELMKKIKDLIGKNGVGSQNNSQLLNQYFNFEDGYTVEKIGNLFLNLNLEPYSILNSNDESIKRLKTKFIFFTYPFLKLFPIGKLNKLVNQVKYDIQKIPSLSKNEIQNKLEIISSLDAERTQFKVIQKKGFKSTFAIKLN